MSQSSLVEQNDEKSQSDRNSTEAVVNYKGDNDGDDVYNDDDDDDNDYGRAPGSDKSKETEEERDTRLQTSSEKSNKRTNASKATIATRGSNKLTKHKAYKQVDNRGDKQDDNGGDKEEDNEESDRVGSEEYDPDIESELDDRTKVTRSSNRSRVTSVATERNDATDFSNYTDESSDESDESRDMTNVSRVSSVNSSVYKPGGNARYRPSHRKKPGNFSTAYMSNRGVGARNVGRNAQLSRINESAAEELLRNELDNKELEINELRSRNIALVADNKALADEWKLKSREVRLVDKDKKNIESYQNKLSSQSNEVKYMKQRLEIMSIKCSKQQEKIKNLEKELQRQNEKTKNRYTNEREKRSDKEHEIKVKKDLSGKLLLANQRIVAKNLEIQKCRNIIEEMELDLKEKSQQLEIQNEHITKLQTNQHSITARTNGIENAADIDALIAASKAALAGDETSGYESYKSAVPILPPVDGASRAQAARKDVKHLDRTTSDSSWLEEESKANHEDLIHLAGKIEQLGLKRKDVQRSIGDKEENWKEGAIETEKRQLEALLRKAEYDLIRHSESRDSPRNNSSTRISPAIQQAQRFGEETRFSNPRDQPLEKFDGPKFGEYQPTITAAHSDTRSKASANGSTENEWNNNMTRGSGRTSDREHNKPTSLDENQGLGPWFSKSPENSQNSASAGLGKPTSVFRAPSTFSSVDTITA